MWFRFHMWANLGPSRENNFFNSYVGAAGNGWGNDAQQVLKRRRDDETNDREAKRTKVEHCEDISAEDLVSDEIPAIGCIENVIRHCVAHADILRCERLSESHCVTLLVYLVAFVIQRGSNPSRGVDLSHVINDFFQRRLDGQILTHRRLHE